MSNLLSEPKDLKKEISLHFIIQGRWFTEKIQSFVIEHNLTHANKLLDELRPLPKYQQRKMLFNGEGQFYGNTLCDKKECEQCNPLRHLGGFRFENKPDKKFKRLLKEHQKFLKENFFEIDDSTVITKAIVSNVIVCKVTLEKIKEVRYKKNEYERLSDRGLNKSYLRALDDWEIAQDNLFREYGIIRGEDYKIGTRDWKQKIEVESILDIIEAQAVYDDEIKEVIRSCKNTGTITAMASEKLYQITTKNVVDSRSEGMMSSLAKNIKRPSKTKPTKETVRIGDFDVPKHLITDYVNAVKMSNTSAMIYKARYGELDPIVEQKKLETRIELHKKIFKALKLPYHQDIDHRSKKLSKKEKQSLDFQRDLQEYMEAL